MSVVYELESKVGLLSAYGSDLECGRVSMEVLGVEGSGLSQWNTHSERRFWMPALRIAYVRCIFAL